jgi:predicted NAD/FAD-binding protein|tara:strand:- start:824 stop:946 length:123 start_codon:yes stop_codon:yes gene_type:complete
MMISHLIKLTEKKLPSSIPYSKNEVTLHTDESIMPKNKLI